jgi:hypothetical protein
MDSPVETLQPALFPPDTPGECNGASADRYRIVDTARISVEHFLSEERPRVNQVDIFGGELARGAGKLDVGMCAK